MAYSFISQVVKKRSMAERVRKIIRVSELQIPPDNIELGLDARIVELIRLIRPSHSQHIVIFPGRDIYVKALVNKVESELAAETYFGREQIVREIVDYEEFAKAAEGITGCYPRYRKNFADGAIQVAGFGQEWETSPGVCYAIYGHIPNREK